MNEAIIALLAQALGLDAAALTTAIESVKGNTPAPAATEGKVPFTKANGEVVMATPKQVAAWTRFRDNTAPAFTAKTPVTPTTQVTQVTQATLATGEAKQVGFRASGALARRSAYVVADLLGLDNTPATRKVLLDTPKDALLAQIAAAGVSVEVVPAAQLG